MGDSQPPFGNGNSQSPFSSGNSSSGLARSAWKQIHIAMTMEEVQSALGYPEYKSNTVWRYRDGGLIYFGRDGRVSVIDLGSRNPFG